MRRSGRGQSAGLAADLSRGLAQIKHYEIHIIICFYILIYIGMHLMM